MLHHVDLLTDEVSAESEEEGVRAGHAGFFVEEREPFLWEETQTDFAWFLSHLAIADV